MQEEFFPVAAWYGGGQARAPMLSHFEDADEEAWARDIAAIRDAGFNTVRCWMDWSTGEPEPGRFDFSVLDLVMDLARQAGLRVIIQVYMDAAPDWLDGLYPEARLTTQHGHRVESQGSPGFCFDHPGVRMMGERFLRALAMHVRNRPEFYAWDVWSEPHVANWAYVDYLPQPVFCYCHYTVERFRSWLVERYGSTQALNRTWYRSFPHVRFVNAPRFSTLQNYAEFVDWQLFLMDKLAEDLAWRARVIKSVDPDHIVSSHSAWPSIMHLPLLHNGEPDDWKMARAVDIWGTSVYPHHAGAPRDAAVRSAMLTATRCAAAAAGKPFWLGELQGGLGYVGLYAAPPVTPADVRLWGWEAVGHGAKGICYYAFYPMSCGYESNGFGMVELDGRDRGRLCAAGSVGRDVHAHAALFLRCRPRPARVAILYDVLSHIQWTCMRNLDSTLPRAANLGVYRALYERNIAADYLHINEVEAGHTKQYAVIFVPFGIMLTRRAASALSEFVRRGGILVAEARTGWNDEHGRCGNEGVPGFGLMNVFGCREVAVVSKDRVPVQRVGRPTVEGVFWEQRLERLTESAEVLARFPDGSPACIVHRYGQGRAVLIGSLLSAAYELNRDPEVGAWLAEFCELAGVSPVATVTVADDSSRAQPVPHVHVLEADQGGRSVLVVTNPYDTAVQADVFVSEIPPGGTLTDLLTGQPVSVEAVSGSGLGFKIDLPGKDVRVLLYTTAV